MTDRYDPFKQGISNSKQEEKPGIWMQVLVGSAKGIKEKARVDLTNRICLPIPKAE